MSNTTIYTEDPYKNLNDSDVYCRIENGVIIEYPVYGIHIRNRHAPLDAYTKVIFNIKPPIPQYHTLVEQLSLFDGKPMVSYAVTPLSFAALVNSVTPRSADPFNKPDINVDDLAPEFINRVIELAEEYTNQLLLEFVKSRKYDSVVSAIGYKDSTVTAYALEAARVIELRDSVWPALETYVKAIYAKTAKFPHTLTDVKAQLPALTWTNER